jgi:hypothetical protein
VLIPGVLQPLPARWVNWITLAYPREVVRNSYNEERGRQK